MNVVVTGGAGYIGSVAVKTLLDNGHDVVVVDNLSKGKVELVDKRAKIFTVDLVDIDSLMAVFSGYKVDAVMHFAGYKAVGESMKDAVKYSDNIIGTINLLKCMVATDVKKIIYSSSAAVYGAPEESVVSEESAVEPVNYYGFTKLECEKLIEWFSRVHGISYVSLRYFNVAGDVLGYVDPEAQNVLPIIMETVVGKRDEFVVFGDDYDTPDGSCVRDYIHVQDLVDAHIMALSVDRSCAINLGSSKGYSVKELLAITKEVSGVDFSFSIGARREGDPGMLVASNSFAKEILGWEAKRDIKDMVKSTYEAYRR